MKYVTKFQGFLGVYQDTSNDLTLQSNYLFKLFHRNGVAPTSGTLIRVAPSQLINILKRGHLVLCYIALSGPNKLNGYTMLQDSRIMCFTYAVTQLSDETITP